MTRIRIYLTGRPAVEVGDVLLSDADLGGRQATLVLARLAWRPGEPVGRDDLAELLWGLRRTASWETGLATVVSALRGTLGVTGLELAAPHGAYLLVDSTSLWVDVAAARSALHEAEGAVRSGRMHDVYGWTGVATTITRRPFLAGHDSAWIDEGRQELRSIRLRALDAAARFCTWNAEHAAAVAHAQTMLALDPLREPSHRRLMAAHAAAGDRASALRVYQDCRRVLAHELGVDPAAATQQAYEALLRD